MSLIVQKYGGTSVGSVERIQAVARRVGASARAPGISVVVVVSAMSGETNQLLDLAHRCAPQPALREVDVLIATGEQVTGALLAIALQEQGVPARSFLGHQIRIDTDSAYGRARIQRIDDERHARRARSRRGGGGGRASRASTPTANITTLGRGGSDTSGGGGGGGAQGRRVRDLHRRRRRLHRRPAHLPAGAQAATASRTTRCSSSPASAPRCCRSARSSSPSATTCRVHVRSSFDDSAGTWVVPGGSR